MIEYYCVQCGRSFARFNSLQRKCGLCAKNMTAKKPMKRLGKIGKQWLSDRQQWIKDNPPDHQGYWYCVIGNKALTIDSLTVDHDISRGRDQSKRREQRNLQPMCAYHNNAKGSLSTAEYLTTLENKQCP